MSTKPVITIFDLRKAALKRALSDLFPEHEGMFKAYRDKPGCGNCWRELYNSIAGEEDKLRVYFGDVDFDLYRDTAQSSDPSMATATQVINCTVDVLHDRVLEIWSRTAGMKQVYLARHGNDITAIIHSVDVGDSGQGTPVVINCSIGELQDKLDKLDKVHPGPKMFASTRYEDSLTLIAVPLA